MTFAEALVAVTLAAIGTGYNPPMRPACAFFVSEMLYQAGWKGESIGYVPNFFVQENFQKLNAGEVPRAGDIVIFKQTYDAVKPKGVGPEDDKTHVGILIEKIDGVWTFAHYSAYYDKPVLAKMTDSATQSTVWTDHIESFLRVYIDVEISDPDTTRKLKMFYHSGVDRPKVIFNDEEHSIAEMIATIRTTDGHEVFIHSHPCENQPCVCIDKNYFPIESIGEKGIEYKK